MFLFCRHIISLCVSTLLAGTAVACSEPNATVVAPEQPEVDVVRGEEIIIGVTESGPETRGTEFTSLNGKTLYWAMTTGNANSEKCFVGSTSYSSSSASPSINTGKYQTYNPTTYNYYVSNTSITTSTSYWGGSVTVSAPAMMTESLTAASNVTETVVGRASTNSAQVGIGVGHIFARLVQISVSAPSGYSISVQGWSIKGHSSSCGRGGTYNACNGTWSNISAMTSYADIPNSASNSFDTDLWVIPGDYDLKISYTVSKGDWSLAKTQVVTVSLPVGKKTTVSGTPPADPGAKDITFTTSTNGWGTTHNVTENS